MSDVIPEILPLLNEKQKRLILGIIATEIGHGGIAFLNSLTGTARQTIVNGVAENGISTPPTPVDSSSEKQRIRRPGGGRKPLTDKYPDLHEKIQSLIEPDTYGNPEHPLLWTTWSARKIADELFARFGYDIHFTSIGKELDTMGYSRQQNQKMCQIGSQHPDRDAQFRYINETADSYFGSR